MKHIFIVGLMIVILINSVWATETDVIKTAETDITPTEIQDATSNDLLIEPYQKMENRTETKEEYTPKEETKSDTTKESEQKNTDTDKILQNFDDEYYFVLVKKLKPIKQPDIATKPTVSAPLAIPSNPVTERKIYIRGGTSFLPYSKIKIIDEHSSNHHGFDSYLNKHTENKNIKPKSDFGWNAALGMRRCFGEKCKGYIEIEFAYSKDKYSIDEIFDGIKYETAGQIQEYSYWTVLGMKPNALGARLGIGLGYMSWDLWNGDTSRGFTFGGLVGLEIPVADYFSITGDLIFRTSPRETKFFNHQYVHASRNYTCAVEREIKINPITLRVGARVFF